MNKKSITSDNLTNTSSDFGELLSYIKKSHQNVFKLINTTLIDLYWELGKRLSKKIDQEGWGRGTIVQFARYLSSKAPEIKGFSDKNLWRTKQFYETYHDNEKLASLVRELSWTHNTIIFSRCKTIEERQFYLELSKKESYSKRELERQISASLFERTMVGTSKLSPLVRELQPHAEEVFKDDEVVEYALSRNLSPAMVAQYQLQLPDKKLIKAKLHEILSQRKELGDE